MASNSSKSFLSCPPTHSAHQMMEGTISLCRGLHTNNHMEPGHCWQQELAGVYMHPNCWHCHLILWQNLLLPRAEVLKSSEAPQGRIQTWSVQLCWG